MDRSFAAAARMVALLDKVSLSERRALTRSLAIRLIGAPDSDE
jgi:hypothetical protein